MKKVFALIFEGIWEFFVRTVGADVGRALVVFFSFVGRALVVFFSFPLVMALLGGALFGLGAGWLGVDVGFVLWPLLKSLAESRELPLSAVLLGIGICTLCAMLVAVVLHYRRKAVDWAAAAMTGAALVLIEVIGPFVWRHVRGVLDSDSMWDGMYLLRALVLVACAVWMARGNNVEPNDEQNTESNKNTKSNKNAEPDDERPNLVGAAVLSLCLPLPVLLPWAVPAMAHLLFWPVAFASFLIVPALLLCRIPIHRAVGSAATACLISEVVGAARFMPKLVQRLSEDYGDAMVNVFGCFALAACMSVLCAWLGVRLAHRMEASDLKCFYALFLFVAAVMYLIT